MRISNDLPKEYIEDEHNLFSGASNRDYSIKVGTVRELVYSSEKNQTKYIVETIDRGRLVPITCTILVKFGGLPKDIDKKMLIWEKVAKREPQITWGYTKNNTLKKGKGKITCPLMP